MSRFVKIFVVFVFVLITSQMTFAAVFTVTKTADTNDGTCDSDCSLREAIGAAVATPSNDVVDFDFDVFVNPQTITLSGSEIVITSNGTLTIQGLSADRLTIDGNNASRIISNNPGAVTIISEITFTNGNGVGTVNTGRGGAIYNNGGNLTLNSVIINGNKGNVGGGTNNAGTGSVMTFNDCIISNNTSISSGGGMQNFSTSTLIINNSTISGNTSGGSTGGGAMQANGMVRITNSTLTLNNAPGGSGGAIAYNGTGMILTNVTISGNTSTNNGGGVHKSTSNLNSFWRNTIVAENNGALTSPDVTGVISSEGNNLIANAGTSTGWLTSDITNQPAILSPLGFYGGKGLTYLPLPGSAAVNGGQNCVVTQSCPGNNPPIAVTTDQRGATRSGDSTVDIGAVEASNSYIANLPDAVMGQNYNFTIAPDNSGYVYLLQDGSFGGINLVNSGKLTFLSGFSNQLGTSTAAVLVTNGINSTVINYSITVYGTGSFPVSGSVTSASSVSVNRAFVILTNQNGNVLTSRTNPFGYFEFSNVPSGNYTITAIAKGLRFGTKEVIVNRAVTDVEIRALP